MNDINNIVVGVIEASGSNYIDDVLAELNIRLIRVDENRPILDGNYAVYIQSPKRESIYLSKSCPSELRNFVVAHEIGHAVLHSDILDPLHIPKRSTRQEEEADYFATRLLNYDLEIIDGYSTEDYSKLLGIRETAVKYII